MQRALAILITAIMTISLSSVIAGCDDDKKQRRMRRSIPRSRVAQEARPLTPEEAKRRDFKRAVMAKDVWRWPEDSGPARDVVVDAKACDAAIAANPSLKYTNPLVQLKWHANCMRRKGWEENPDSRTLEQIR